MDLEHDAIATEQLLVECNALRVTESYRRVHFTSLRDDAIARWRASGHHDTTSQHFVEHRVARGERALAEVLELEVHSDVAYAMCCTDLAERARLSAKDQKKTLADVADVASRAVREEMRYRTTLLGTLQYEVNELTMFIDDHAG
ncbi:MAG: hypothetical protein HKL85_02335 [Acidimicrobiaceae bacterium]|nr:hypothetical protein [Acidimicrobiaceae bacterium]